MIDNRASGIRIRQIESADIDDLIALLLKGFRKRTEGYWRRAFRHLSERKAPPSYPRFGYLLEHGEKKVGLIILIYSERTADGEPCILCNLSCWYVEPMYRAYGGLLISKATRDRNVTYFNMSPSAHTLPTIEAQGFKRYCEGEIIAVPALSRRVSRANVEEFKTDCYYGPALSKEERELLISHVAYGCIALIVRRGDKISPFLFLHRRSFRRLLPTLQLIYCRDLQEFSEYAGRIGRALLRRGVLFFRLDAPGPLPGVSGIYLAGHGLRYFRGPHPPHIGDFTFTETIFLGW